MLLAGTVPLFLGAALSDAAYARTYEIQWTSEPAVAGRQCIPLAREPDRLADTRESQEYQRYVAPDLRQRP